MMSSFLARWFSSTFFVLSGGEWCVFFLQDVVSWCFAVIAAGSPQIFSADGSHQRQKRIFDYVSREAKTISLSFRC